MFLNPAFLCNVPWFVWVKVSCAPVGGWSSVILLCGGRARAVCGVSHGGRPDRHPGTAGHPPGTAAPPLISHSRPLSVAAAVMLSVSRVSCTVCRPVTPVECTSCWFLICSFTTRTNTTVPPGAPYASRSGFRLQLVTPITWTSESEWWCCLCVRSLTSYWWWGPTLFIVWVCPIKTGSWGSAHTVTVTSGKNTSMFSHALIKENVNRYHI